MSIKNGDMPQNGAFSVSNDFNSSEDMGGIGLTKREQFAAMAMQAMISSKYYSEFCGRYDSKEDGVAISAVEHADALLAQLEEKGDE